MMRLHEAFHGLPHAFSAAEKLHVYKLNHQSAGLTTGLFPLRHAAVGEDSSHRPKTV
jgi:hypothetical protein